jgi:hypothetical protein
MELRFRYTDDPAIIKKRHGNTVEFYLPVTPSEAGPVHIALSLSYVTHFSWFMLWWGDVRTLALLAHAIVQQPL